MAHFFTELRRRKVWLVGGVYVAASWVLIQLVSVAEEPLSLPGWFDTGAFVVLGIGFPIALILAWAQETQAEREAPAENDAPESREADPPSIAVLPFDNMSEETEYEYLGDGMAEEIITLLAQAPDLFVIARNSSFAYKGTAPDIRNVGRELGVRYVLEGSIRKIGEQIRVTAQLIEAETGVQLWADRYNRPIATIFELQDEVCTSIAEVLGGEIFAGEVARFGRQRPENLDAWGLYIKARGLQGNRGFIAETVPLLRRAVELDENLAVAHAYLSYCLQTNVSFGASHDPEKDLAEATSAMERSLQLARDNPTVITFCARTMSTVGGIERAIRMVEQAIETSPFFPDLYWALGYLLVCDGRAEEAIDANRRALRQSPRDLNAAAVHMWIAMAQVLLDDHEGAVLSVRESVERNPKNFTGWIVLANSLALIDRITEAHEAIERAKVIAPRFSLSLAEDRFQAMFENEEDAAKLTAGLRKLDLE